MIRVPFVLLVVSSFLLGCGATVPHQTAWRPWSRITGINEPVSVGATVATVVSGKTKPLIGDDSLLAVELEGLLDDLLQRRGFVIDDSLAETSFQLSYETREVEHLNASFSQSSLSAGSLASYSYSGSGVGSSTGWGVTTAVGISIAETVAKLSIASRSQQYQSFEKYTGYKHTLALEINDIDGHTIWKAESSWESSTPDIRGKIVTVYQTILSQLPRDESIIPRVRSVKNSHFHNYFDQYCAHRDFNCPALPYQIYFDWIGLGVVQDAYALAAYVDLFQTAENALPTGTKKYQNPTDIKLWTNAMLSGVYYLGDSEQTVTLFIELKGSSYGYRVEGCYIGDDKDIAQYREKEKRWHAALSQYFDMYEK